MISLVFELTQEHKSREKLSNENIHKANESDETIFFGTLIFE